MAEIEFIYNGERIIIQFKKDEKMKDICKKFKEKAKIDDSQVIFYSYDGKLGINEELLFDDIANYEDKKRSRMSVLVNENEIPMEQKEIDIIKSKTIICPKCKENIKMNIKDYKINLFECKNGHKIENILLNEFEETQELDILNIICDRCIKNNKSISFNNTFYRCNTCKQTICPLCISNHDKSHKIINYDDKYYICDKHDENYISYCEECKLNLCTLCDGHKNHNKINFIDVLPKKDKLFKTLNTLKNYIDLLNNDIKMLIGILNEVKNKMSIYYKINKDIITNYNTKNRNFEIIYYLNQFNNNSNKIIDDLNNVIKSNNAIDKFNNIFDLYRQMNIDEITLIYNIKDKKEIKLFDGEFFERYKGYCNLIIDGKEQELKEKHTIIKDDKDKDFLEIKLNGITNITNMNGIFSWCSSLTSLPDISNWNTLNITKMKMLFNNCKSLISLSDISKWNTINVTDISGMFNNCSSLSYLPEIGRWNTSEVTNMSEIFCNCSSLLSLPDISKWNTSKVIYMTGIFSNCSSLISLPEISEWNIENVINMRNMFANCSSLSSLPDISKWNTSNVNNMSGMFYNCKLLSSIPDISKWDISNVNNMNAIFKFCKESLNIPCKFQS